MWKASFGASREPLKTISNTEGTGAVGGVLICSVLAQKESCDFLVMPTTGMENLLLLRLALKDLPPHA